MPVPANSILELLNAAIRIAKRDNLEMVEYLLEMALLAAMEDVATKN